MVRAAVGLMSDGGDIGQIAAHLFSHAALLLDGSSNHGVHITNFVDLAHDDIKMCTGFFCVTDAFLGLL